MSGGTVDAMEPAWNAVCEVRLRFPNLGFRREPRTAARRPGGLASVARRTRLAATTGQTPAATTGRGAALSGRRFVRSRRQARVREILETLYASGLRWRPAWPVPAAAAALAARSARLARPLRIIRTKLN
jgi:hypothetical protein